MKFAYADPPYMGQAKKHYGSDAEVNHLELLRDMNEDFPDGWALSCSNPSLFQIIPMINELDITGCRIGIWIKPFCSFKPNVNPAYAWEPIIFKGGRKRGRDIPTLRDWESCNITLKRGLSGVKPDKICYWIFDWWNVKANDQIIDLFPGSGAVSIAFDKYLLNRKRDVSQNTID